MEGGERQTKWLSSGSGIPDGRHPVYKPEQSVYCHKGVRGNSGKRPEDVRKPRAGEHGGERDQVWTDSLGPAELLRTEKLS